MSRARSIMHMTQEELRQLTEMRGIRSPLAEIILDGPGPQPPTVDHEFNKLCTQAAEKRAEKEATVGVGFDESGFWSGCATICVFLMLFGAGIAMGCMYLWHHVDVTIRWLP